MLAAERSTVDQHRLALRRYEVAFASITGRGRAGRTGARGDRALARPARGHPLHAADRPRGRRRGPAGHAADGRRRQAGAGRRQDEHGVLGRGDGDRRRRASGSTRCGCTCATSGRARRNWQARATSAGRTRSTARSCSCRRTRPWWPPWTPTRNCCAGCSTAGCSYAGRPGSRWSRRRAVRRDRTRDRRRRGTGAHAGRRRASRGGRRGGRVQPSSTHLQRFLSARRRELDALEASGRGGPADRGSGQPDARSPSIRRAEEMTNGSRTVGYGD